MLLSAEPMLVESRADSAKPLSADNVALNLTKSRVTGAGSLDSLAAGFSNLPDKTAVIDLRRDASQDSQGRLRPGAEPGLLEWVESTDPAKQLQSVIVDLGNGDDQAELSRLADGRLRLATAGALYDLIFNAPSALLGIRGSSGVDKVVIGTTDLNLGQATLDIEAETIEVSAAARVQTGADIFLVAESIRQAGEIADSTPVSVSARAGVSVLGTLQARDVKLVSRASATLAVTPTTAPETLDVDIDLSATAVLGPAASVLARSVALVADTEASVRVTVDSATNTQVTVDVTQTSSAGLLGKAAVAIRAPGANEISAPVDPVADSSPYRVLIESAARSDVVTGLVLVDDSQDNTNSVDRVGSLTRIDRTAHAFAGDGSGTAAIGPLLDASGRTVGQAPVVQIGAFVSNLTVSGVSGSVTGKRIGTHTNESSSLALSEVKGARIDAARLGLLALDSSSQKAEARQARNLSQVSVAATLSDAIITTVTELAAIAQDRSSFIATGGGYTGANENWGLNQFASAIASNRVTSEVKSATERVTLSAESVRSWALAGARLEAKVTPVAGFKPGDALLMTIHAGPQRAWNTLGGSALARVDDSVLIVGKGLDHLQGCRTGNERHTAAGLAGND